MATNHTTHYDLNQWQATDQVLRTDFNADNAKIDAALAGKAETETVSALQTAVAGKAEQADLSEVQASTPRIAAGTYTGDGEKTRTIPVGFTPKAVLVFPQNSQLYSSGSASTTYGGLAVTGGSAVNSQDVSVVSIVSGGFQVSYQGVNNIWYVASNASGRKYNYFAIG